MGTYNAGQILTGAMLNGLTQSYSALGTSLVVGTSLADIPSATVTFTVEGSNGSYCCVYFEADVSPTIVAGSNTCGIFAVVDGAVQSSSESLIDERVTRGSVSGMTGKISLSAGSHTIKLQAIRSGGTFTVNDAIIEVRVVDLF